MLPCSLNLEKNTMNTSETLSNFILHLRIVIAKELTLFHLISRKSGQVVTGSLLGRTERTNNFEPNQ
jgi:hypothetical protein